MGGPASVQGLRTARSLCGAAVKSRAHPHKPQHACLRPAELEQLVCGGRVVDLSALEAATHYQDGYHASSRPVRWFWEVRSAAAAARAARAAPLGWHARAQSSACRGHARPRALRSQHAPA
jgi:hypothetical protein